MGETTEFEQCAARWRHKRVKYGEAHSGRCQREEGHDGAHEWKEEGGSRTVLWFGDSVPPDVTKYRFGRWLQEN